MPKSKIKRSAHLLKELVMIFLGVLSVTLVVIDVATTLNLNQQLWLVITDWLISLGFFIDYFVHHRYSPHKKHFLRRHWFDFFAAVPAIGCLQGLIIFRVIRLAIRLKILMEASREYTRHAYLIYITTIVSIILISGAAGFYHFEHEINPNVHTFSDALWWALVTIATIGYGDIYPVTSGGRIIASIIIVIGIATLGSLIAVFQNTIGNLLPKPRR